MKLADAMQKKEKTLQAIVKDLKKVRAYLMSYAKITDDTDTEEVLDIAQGKEESVSKKRKPAIKKISFVAEEFSAESFDTEDNFYRIAGIIDDLIINLQRLHNEKSNKKQKYYTDDDFETEKVYRVKDAV